MIFLYPRELISGTNCEPNVETELCDVNCPPECVINGKEYYLGNITSKNSTHTWYVRYLTFNILNSKLVQ